MYAVDCTPTWIVPVPKPIDTSPTRRSPSSDCAFLSTGTGGRDLGAPAGSARRFSSFTSLAAAWKGERTPTFLTCVRPPQLNQQETGVLSAQGRFAQQNQILPEQHQISQQQVTASFELPVRLQTFSDVIPVQERRSSIATTFEDWIRHTYVGIGGPASSSKKHPRLAAGNRGKFAADPYRQGGRATGPRMITGSSTTSIKPPNPPRKVTAAVEEDVAVATGGDAADTEDDATEPFGGIHEDDSSGNAGYQALQNALACVVASGRSAELLIWGVRCFIERDFPCLFKSGRTLTGLDGSSELPSKSVVSAELQADAAWLACGGGEQHSKLNADGAPSGKEGNSGGQSGDAAILLQDLSGSIISSSAELGMSSSSTTTENAAGMCYSLCAQRSSFTGSAAEGCCCTNGNCSGRQVVVASVEGHRQRDRKVLKWLRHNLLRSGDVVILITAWERAEEPKYLRVPGMILSSSVDASTYNLTMATRLTSRVKQLGAALLSDCRVYPLVVPLARATKAPVGDLLCQSARELQADLLVVGSHGHTSLRQVLCGSVSRHVRAHAPCRVVMPRV